MKSIFT